MSHAKPRRILVTAGNTQTPIDKVRCITNIFTGRTGGIIALEGVRRGFEVTLLTSHPEVAKSDSPIFHVKPYRTFDDLAALLPRELTMQPYDVLIHAAAVSDYSFAGVYAPAEADGQLQDIHAGKVKSHYPEVWLKLVKTPKLADQVRSPWGFDGIFVKFKLEVDVSEEQLLEVAERSRQQSQADFMIANSLEGMNQLAFIGNEFGKYTKVERSELSAQLWNRIEAKLS